MQGKKPSSPGVNAWPYIVLFFLSGFTGLVYEVAWVRLFTQVFGNTTYSVTAVLTAFMAGLALGSWFIGRIADASGRPLLLYALLETGIALSAAAIPFIVPALDPVYSYLYNSINFSDALLTAVRFLLSLALMIVPVFLMGGTLPVLGRFLIRHMRDAGPKTGLLYGINTLGAAAGCFATGFYLVKFLGLTGSIFAAAAINLIIAGCFFAAGRKFEYGAESSVRSRKKAAGDGDASARGGLLKFFLVLVAASGFVSLACELLWTRLLVFRLKTTVYAFSTMLTTFLLGIGIGSLVFTLLDRRLSIKSYWKLWGYLQWGISLSCFASIFVFGGMADESSSAGRAWSAHVMRNIIAPSVLVMAIPTLLMGMAFPAAAAIFTRQIRNIGSSLGSLYAASTAGSILGSLTAGLFMVTLLGTEASLKTVTVLSAVIASAALILSPDSIPGKRSGDGAFTWSSVLRYAPLAPWPLLMAAMMFMPPGYLFRYYNIGELEHDRTAVIDYAREGIEGITTVHHFADGGRVISTGSINVAGTAFTLRTTQMLQAHIPMLLHKKPGLVCQVGFGSGETSRIVTSYDIERLDLIEISRDVIDTSDRYFGDINGGVVRNPRFKAIIMDGANYFRLTKQSYDVIMNDSIWPYYAGNSGLYTREYFHAAGSRLRPGGIMTSWVPISMNLASFTVLLKTFHAEFPYVTLWLATSHENQHALIAGSYEKFDMDPVLFRERFRKFAVQDLGEIGYGDPAMFLDICKMGTEAIDSLDSDGTLHTGNTPYLDFTQSRITMHDITNTLTLIALNYRKAPSLLGERLHADARLSAEMETMHDATGHVLRGMILSSGRNPAAYVEYRKALALVPDYPGLSMKEGGSFAFTAAAGKEAGGIRAMLEEAKRLLGEGRYLEMAGILEKALAVDPRSAEALTGLGEAYLNMGRLDEAEAALKRAIDYGPDRFDAYYHLGWIHLRRGSLDEAISRLKEGISCNPDAAEIHYALGKAYVFKKDLRRARKCFERAVELSPFDAEFHFELGMIHERGGRMAEAGKYYRKAVDLDPRHAGAAGRLNYILSLPAE